MARVYTYSAVHSHSSLTEQFFSARTCLLWSSTLYGKFGSACSGIANARACIYVVIKLFYIFLVNAVEVRSLSAAFCCAISPQTLPPAHTTLRGPSYTCAIISFSTLTDPLSSSKIVDPVVLFGADRFCFTVSYGGSPDLTNVSNPVCVFSCSFSDKWRVYSTEVIYFEITIYWLTLVFIWDSFLIF